MTILVAGARGNIGSRVVAKLTEAGHDVRGTTREQLDITRPNVDALRNVDTMFLYPSWLTTNAIRDFVPQLRTGRSASRTRTRRSPPSTSTTSLRWPPTCSPARRPWPRRDSPSPCAR